MLNTVFAANIFTRLFDDQSQYWIDNAGHITLGIVMICICSALVIGLLISVLYMFTNRKRGFAQSLVVAMPMLSALVCTVIIAMCMLIDNSSGTKAAIALTGAFSLTRFRSAPGDPKDIAYIFFSLVMGVMCGIGYVGYAFLIFAVLAVMLVIVYLTGFGMPKSQEMTLKVTIPENLNYDGLFDSVMEKYTTAWLLRRVKTSDFGTLFDLVYSVRVRNDADQKKFIDEIRTLNGNLDVTLVLYRYDDQVYDTRAK